MVLNLRIAFFLHSLKLKQQAPSLIVEAFAAVTVPSFSKTALKLV
jgi:hypothetical protein